MYTCLAECRRVQVPYAAACLATTPTSRSVSYYISLSLLSYVCYIYICLHYAYFHSDFVFTYSMPRFHRPHVMTELLQVTVDRRVGQATVRFLDDLYTQHLLTAFMDHASRWRHVLDDVRHYTFGYRHHDTKPDSWDDACDSAAAFLDHRKLWGSVMQELLLLHLPSPLQSAFLHLHSSSLGVMTDLQSYPTTTSLLPPLLHRRRRTLPPLPLRSDLGRKLTPRHVRRNLLTAFNLAS